MPPYGEARGIKNKHIKVAATCQIFFWQETAGRGLATLPLTTLSPSIHDVDSLSMGLFFFTFVSTFDG
jgi:hypothetical protein